MDHNPEPSPWTRPGFVAAAVLVAVIAVVGIVLAITSGGDDPTPPAAAPVQTTPATATTAPSGDGDDTDSVCGLKGTKTSGRLPKAPDAEWDYQGTTAYPVSKEHGPGRTDPSGYRYCFQHTPEGALFMAANAVAQGSDPSVASQWAEYVVGQGEYREEHMADATGSSSDDGTRLQIMGYRVLTYDGRGAKVDVAYRVMTGSDIGLISGVYELVWQGGDWKISSAVSEPLNVVRIPDLAGYVSWGP